MEKQVTDHNFDIEAIKYACKHILGRLPECQRSNVLLKNTRKVNRYIGYQEQRILKALEDQNPEKAVLLWLVLMKTSKAYQLILFNSTMKGWYYKWDQRMARDIFNKAINQLRRWDLSPTLTRFYIPKKNGKWRPIGAPDPVGKMMSKAFNDMIQCLTVGEQEFQHGFRPNRGVHSAIWRIWLNHEILGMRDIYEFDFRSFFNMVVPSWIKRRLETYSKILAGQIHSMFLKTKYNLTTIREEAELKFMGRMEVTGKPVYLRTGLPQGLPVSPVLSTLAIDNVEPPKGLVMYADDGVIMGRKGDTKYIEWLGKLTRFGAIVAEEKSGWVNGPFKFLGVTIDLVGRKLVYEDHIFSWTTADEKTGMSLIKWLTRVPNHYNPKREEGWEWVVNKNSYATCVPSHLNIWLKSKIVFNSILFADCTNGYRFFLQGGIMDVTYSSSWSCNEFLRNMDHLKLNKIRPFSVEPDLLLEERDRGKYVELIAEERNTIRENHMIAEEELARFMIS